MNQQRQMRVSELATVTGVSVSTIHFYTKEGLLPKPFKTGQTMAYYTDEHLRSLHMIKSLRDAKYSIAAIKQILADKSFEEESKTPQQKSTSPRREDILKSATLLFREKGFNETSITDIIQHAGAGRGTFYAYFNNKEELFFECADKVFLDIDRGQREIEEESDILLKLQQRGTYFFDFYPRAIDMLNLLRGATLGGNEAFREKLNQIMENLAKPITEDIKQGIQEGVLSPGEPEIIAWMLVGIAEYCTCLLHEQGTDTMDQIREDAWDIIFRGCLTEDSDAKQ